jgi:arylsulfatase A-like enzyme
MQRSRGLTRREFLKLVSLVPVGVYSRPISKWVGTVQGTEPNIIILVFDAWSQHHTSLYGYRRHTMPNLERFAETATVFHNHYSTGSYTVPGTASILIGMHPWSHRALQLGGGVANRHADHTIFSALSSTHSTLAFTQNKFADLILHQAEADLDRHADYWAFNVQKTNMYGSSFLEKNHRTSFASIEDNLVQKGEGFDSSLFFGPLARLYTLYDRFKNTQHYGNNYPLGLPDATEFFLLPDVVDGAIDLLKGIQQPSLTYFHFYPPHEPYTPTREFYGSFADGWLSPDKPVHDLSDKKYSMEKLRRERQFYDEFIATWDQEVSRLFQFLNESGLTGNSYIFVTSDHGEMFERGELGHWTPLLYDPVIHVPLIVSSPGQTNRQDVHTLTSSVDLLPTIAHLSGNPIPEWAEGTLLPTLGGEEEERRSVFSMDAKTNSSFTPLVNYSICLTRDHHRLAYYCYPKDQYEKFEFYDLAADRDELKDLYPSQPALAVEMQDELLQKVSEVNRLTREHAEE